MSDNVSSNGQSRISPVVLACIPVIGVIGAALITTIGATVGPIAVALINKPQQPNPALSAPTPPQTGVSTPPLKITEPKKDTLVDMRGTTISGTYQNVPVGKAIWVVIRSHADNKFYPQNKPAVLPNGKWQSFPYFGNEQDTGRKFDIYVVSVDEDEKKEIDEYLHQPEDQKIGLPDLPGTTYDEPITVTRK